MFDTVTIGRKIAELRKAHNMTQFELADALGISFQAVSNWERGASMPDISKLPELAEIFGVTIDEVLGKKNPAIVQLAHGETIDTRAVTPEEIEEAAMIAKAANVKKLLLTHTWPEYEKDLYLKEARYIFDKVYMAKVYMAHENDVIELA